MGPVPYILELGHWSIYSYFSFPPFSNVGEYVDTVIQFSGFVFSSMLLSMLRTFRIASFCILSCHHTIFLYM